MCSSHKREKEVNLACQQVQGKTDRKSQGRRLGKTRASYLLKQDLCYFYTISLIYDGVLFVHAKHAHRHWA